jgi:DNA polymerase-3 subunit epsilon
VDAAGNWSLREEVERPGPPFAGHGFAVVDVETTGGGWGKGDRITEIAIVHVDGGSVGAVFDTLVNPGRPIPPWVQGLTGITDAMVAEAPPFEGVADQVLDVLGGRVFVAHNAGFDWGFVQAALLAATGEVPVLERLCTVRLGRLLVPRLRSHGLDSMTGHYKIRVEGRHRALGDALATAQLLIRLFGEAEARGISDLGALRLALGGALAPRESHRPARKES